MSPLPGADPPPLLHEWLHRAADRWPDRPAIVESGRETTLAELRAQATALAGAFRQSGLLPGDRVALVIEKSRDAIVALYGAMMAGGVYVPLPPLWPRARIDAVLRDCDARIVVSSDAAESAGRLLIHNPAAGTTGAWPIPAPVSGADAREPAAGDPDRPAFILFTSGSTGTPKGVTISHAAAGAFVDWTAREFGLGPGDRIACPSPLGFDLSTFDVLNIGRSGSACVVLPEATRWVPRLLFQELADLGVTAWYSVPSALNAVADTPNAVAGRLAGVRLFLLAGEVFPPRLAAALRGACPRARILNLYGPTETNVVTWHELPESIDPERPVPIGVACPYARVLVRPDEGPAGDSGGTIGELLLAGQSMMAGYWNRAADTDGAFVEIGVGRDRARYYRSGDRVSLLPDGQLHFIGRIDRQIKRRGIRIELGEIESVLGRNESVAEAAVAVTGSNPPVVTAFVTLRGGKPAELDDLRLHCARLLPASMLPDRFVILAQMPRGNRGKIDYERLSSWEPAGA